MNNKIREEIKEEIKSRNKRDDNTGVIVKR